MLSCTCTWWLHGGLALTVQGDSNYASVLLLEVFAVGLDRRTMSNEEVVADGPGLPAAVADVALAAVAGAARGEQAGAVAQDRAAPGLVEGDPQLDGGAKGLETYPRIVLKVLDKLVLVQQAAVALVEVVGQVPVEEGDEGLDARRTQVFGKLNVVLDALVVDGVVAAAEGDDTRPG
jgi:hypothetical protein